MSYAIGAIPHELLCDNGGYAVIYRLQVGQGGAPVEKGKQGQRAGV